MIERILKQHSSGIVERPSRANDARSHRPPYAEHQDQERIVRVPEIGFQRRRLAGEMDWAKRPVEPSERGEWLGLFRNGQWVRR